MANSQCRNNAIEMLHSYGCVISSSPKIQDLIVHYNEDLSKSASWRPRLDALVFYSLDSLSASLLKRPFNEDGVFFF